MKPTTLEEALSMVPTHWMLTPGVDVWQEGDVWHERGMTWRIEKANRDIGRKVNIPFAGRPISQDVRESAAWWLLYNALAIVPPELDGVTLQVSDDPREKWMPLSLWKHYATKTITGMRKFENNVEADKCIVMLGGEQRIIKELSAGPDPLGRWILAGKP